MTGLWFLFTQQGAGDYERDPSPTLGYRFEHCAPDVINDDANGSEKGFATS